MTAQPLEDRLADYIRENGLKNTRQRQVILDAFVDSHGHVSVEELLTAVQERDTGIGHATVYRTLKLFTDAGVAHVRRFGDGQSRYEPVIVGDEHHDHLICQTCGHIFEFEDDIIEARQSRVAKEHGLRVTSHRHEVFGECLAPDTCKHNTGATGPK